MDIRWQQRYENYAKAFRLLTIGLEIVDPSETERAGVIQFYEITFELAWKVLKDYLTEEGYTIKSPRESIKTAYQAGYIENGQTWLEALEDRNITVHTYDDAVATEIYDKISRRYFPLLQNFNSWIGQQIN